MVVASRSRSEVSFVAHHDHFSTCLGDEAKSLWGTKAPVCSHPTMVLANYFSMQPQTGINSDTRPPATAAGATLMPTNQPQTQRPPPRDPEKQGKVQKLEALKKPEVAILGCRGPIEASERDGS